MPIKLHHSGHATLQFRYLPQVDHWRAVAANWIVLYHGLHVVGGLLTSHAPLDTYFVSSNPIMASIIEGHSAVALFMVLSGFIFTYGAFGRSVSYVPFLKNRFLRIYPLFLVTVFVAIASNPGKVSLDKFLFTVLPLADYSQLDAGPFVSMVWAVAVEFQFYLIFPFLLGFLNKSPLKVICGVIACALIFRLMSVALGASARDLSYWHIIGRIDQFLLGMAAAVLIKQGGLRATHYRVVLLVGVLLGVAFLFGFHRLGGRSVDGT
ncbi:acyltransferase family protein [Cupriavidus metallidurans]|uniref:acyltransferase family protein n=1 Tax=Cupriavidus metallidurans TaxID=119219 RepID=UPI003D0112A7